MRNGKTKKFGLDETLSTLARADRKPLLGVCLGAQLMTQSRKRVSSPDGLGKGSDETVSVR